jgi:ABC-2 type transport system permease protein
MTTSAVTAGTIAARRAPSAGGLNPTLVLIELRRVFRNRRTLVFTLVMPAVFFLLFGTNSGYKTESAGNGNITAYVLVSMAVYGAMLATTSGGASVSIERAAGWSRQLRLTPLNPAAYVAVKLITAMALGLASVVVVMIVGKLAGAQMPLTVWIESAALAWICSIVFAAFGLFMGYLLPSDNVMQIIGPALAILAFAGGLFVPVDQLGHTFATIAKYTPVYGVGEIARAPLTGTGFTVAAFANVIVWTTIFVVGATWRFRRDTNRV